VENLSGEYRTVSLDELAQLVGRFEVLVAACPQYADTDGY